MENCDDDTFLIPNIRIKSLKMEILEDAWEEYSICGCNVGCRSKVRLLKQVFSIDR